jgi:hypothetical protein
MLQLEELVVTIIGGLKSSKNTGFIEDLLAYTHP